MPRRPPVVLRVDGVSVFRGATRILSGVNWSVRRGEHWVVLGANGSGKTSLLAVLTGYLTPSEGEIGLLGRNYGEDDWRALRREVGLVSSSIRQMMADSEPALLTVVSGRHGMIDFWGRPGVADRRRARAILRRIECEHLADRPWAYLSQGERQRVLIGRSLMADPGVLILDEPCAGLDPVARERFLQFLERLGRAPGAPTLLLVTHHVEEIIPVFTHALLLKRGEVAATGRLEQVLTSRRLSEAFEARVRLSGRKGRYGMVVTPRRGVVT